MISPDEKLAKEIEDYLNKKGASTANSKLGANPSTCPVGKNCSDPLTIGKKPDQLDAEAAYANPTPEMEFHTGSRPPKLEKFPLDAADRARIEKIRKSIGAGIKRNIAYADGYVNGKSIGEIVGVSGENTVGVAMPAKRRFTTGVDQYDREFDSEVFVLEKLAEKLKPTDCGTIKLVSERKICDSCSGVIRQFQQMFPNIHLILVEGIR